MDEQDTNPKGPRIEDLASRFMALFAGLARAYGTYDTSGEKDDRGKQQGTAVTKREPVTAALWRKHIIGEQGLGIVPVRDDATSVFGAIDIDSYADLDHSLIVQQLQKFEAPLVVCRSKSGGAHLYLFAAEPVSAKKMQDKLRELAAALGYSDSEIFPKQSKLDTDKAQAGNWINMPYFNGLKGLRYAVKRDGDAMTVEEFLNFAEAAKVTAEYFSKRVTQHADFPDGPPCLQHLAKIGIRPGQRNDALYNIAVYCHKSAGDSDWQNAVHLMNQKYLTEPLSNSEVQGVLTSVGKKKNEYGYKCTAPPIRDYCDRALCRTRKHGVGASGAMPVFGQLTKFDTNPPTWLWEIEGKQVALSTDDLMEYNRFAKKLLEKLNVTLPDINRNTWRMSYVKPAVESVHVEEMPEDASPEGGIWLLLEKFCIGRAQAQSWAEILHGRPFTEEGLTWFRLADFKLFIERNHVRGWEEHQLTRLLKMRGAKHEFKKLKGKGTNIWGVTEFSQPDSPFEVPDSVRNSTPAF